MIKEYKGDYNKSEFYSLMGKFFAEPLYKKELPYLTNRGNTVWHIKIENNSVTAFSGYEETKNKIDFKTDYYIKNIDDLEAILKYKLEILKDCKKEITTTVSNKEIINLFLKYGFKKIRKTTNYTTLIKEYDENAK